MNGDTKKPNSKTYKISIGSNSTNVNFFGANRQLDNSTNISQFTTAITLS